MYSPEKKPIFVFVFFFARAAHIYMYVLYISFLSLRIAGIFVYT